MFWDDPIPFPSAEDEQPRLYFSPEVINRELCRMIGERSGAYASQEARPMKLAERSTALLPARGYEWPLR
jgi:hypothetical protein